MLMFVFAADESITALVRTDSSSAGVVVVGGHVRSRRKHLHMQSLARNPDVPRGAGGIQVQKRSGVKKKQTYLRTVQQQRSPA